MAHGNEYQTKLNAAKALKAEDVKEPNIPIGIYLQEAEDLKIWSTSDIVALVEVGLEAKTIEDLGVCAGATRTAQSLWQKAMQTREQDEQKWLNLSPEAFRFRDRLLHSYRYAFRGRSDLLATVSKIAEGNSNADMIQDLNDLAELGKANTEPLEAISFDLNLLDKADTDADMLAEILAGANGDRLGFNELRDMRDRMYTLLKECVDEVRECGKYVFWDKPDRYKGYISRFLKRQNKQYKQLAGAVEENVDEGSDGASGGAV